MEKQKNISYFFLTAVVLVLLDQLTKILIKGFDLFGIHHQGLQYGELIPIIGTFVQLTFIENPGMAWGIHFGDIGKFFLSSFSIIASIALIYILNKIRNNHFGVKLGFTLILAGAFGNLIDRVFYGVFYGYAPLLYGKVVDFVQVDVPDIDLGFYSMTHFPVFNVADSCVSIGIVILLIFYNHIPSMNEIFKIKKKLKNIQPIDTTQKVNDEQIEQGNN